MPTAEGIYRIVLMSILAVAFIVMAWAGIAATIDTYKELAAEEEYRKREYEKREVGLDTEDRAG